MDLVVEKIYKTINLNIEQLNKIEKEIEKLNSEKKCCENTIEVQKQILKSINKKFYDND